MSAERTQEIADPQQGGFEVLGIRSKPDSKISVHVEVIARHDEDAPFVADSFGERGGAERVRVPHEHDRARFGRDVRQSLLLFDPAPDQRIIRADDHPCPREQLVALPERDSGKPIVDGARSDRRVIVDRPQLFD